MPANSLPAFILDLDAVGAGGLVLLVAALQDDAHQGDPVVASLEREVAGQAGHVELAHGGGILRGAKLRAAAGDLGQLAPLLHGGTLEDPQLVDAEAHYVAGEDLGADVGIGRLRCRRSGRVVTSQDARAPPGVPAAWAHAGAAVADEVVDSHRPVVGGRAAPALHHGVQPGDVARAWGPEHKVGVLVELVGVAPDLRVAN
mmetsp:Transcript_104606/g.296009  ORF Transcript_104606/g.296009 Transcript_104606/m.296009 type:complete len:201 (+) Transcript_104606:222-824(+)